jgi:hypothetical protein
MTAKHLRTGVKPAPETSFVSNIPEATDNAQHNAGSISHVAVSALCNYTQYLSSPFRASCFITAWYS